MTPIIKSVELPNRVRLPYVEQGDPSGVPMLLLHGVTDSWRSFERVLPHLPDSIHAFALTQRGHGDADRPATGYRARDFAADVARSRRRRARPGRRRRPFHGQHQRPAVRDRPSRAHPRARAGRLARHLPGNPGLVEFWESAVSQLTDPIDPASCASSRRARLPSQCRERSSTPSCEKA